MDTQSLVTVAPWSFIFTLVNLLILTLGVKHFLFKPVQNILAKRQAEIEKTYENADLAQKEAQELRTEYESRLENAKNEAIELVKTATQRAQSRSDEMLSTAKAEAAALKEKAAADIERDRKNAAGALKNDISAIALDIAGKVVDKEIDAKAHKELIDRFIENVGDAS